MNCEECDQPMSYGPPIGWKHEDPTITDHPPAFGGKGQGPASYESTRALIDGELLVDFESPFDESSHYVRAISAFRRKYVEVDPENDTKESGLHKS